MGSRFLRHPFGLSSSPRLRGTNFVLPRTSSLLLGVTLAAGALLVAPQAPSAWAAPTVGGDENGPKVEILSPAYQDVLKGRSRILVAVKVTQYNPSSIQLFLDDKPASNLLPLSSLASSSFDWDTRLTAEGPHKLSVRVTDTQGFRGWADVNVYVNNQNVRDTVAPDLAWGNVEAFQQIAGQTQVQLQAKDNFGVKWIIVSLNPLGKATAQPAQKSWLLSKPPYNFNLDTTKVADGLYALSARAWDAMEQEGKSPTLTIGIANSPVNATTVAESLDGLKAMAKAQGGAASTASTTTKTVASLVEKPSTPKPDNRSGNTAKATAPKTPAKAAPVLPPGYELVPKLTSPKTGTQAATAPATAPAPTDSTTAPADAPRVASAPAELETRTTASASLSTSSKKAEVLAPSLSSEAPADEVKTSDPLLVARLDTPSLSARTSVELGNATLSTRQSAIASALAPARVPEGTVEDQARVTNARLAQPSNLNTLPVLTVAQTTLVGTPAPAASLAPATPAKVNAATPRRVTTPSKAVLRQPHQRQPYVVNKITDKAAPAKAPETTLAAVPEFPASVEPQLSQPKTQQGVVTGHSTTATPKVDTRIAALPKTDGRAVEVAPSTTLINPVITVSPVKVAFDKSLPSYYQARRLTTLRAIADHYGLPVELVATTNNWTTDMKVLPGMKVQLPRQAQISYNGQKLRGDVATLIAGDTTFTAMRFLFEHTGGKISWDAAKQEVVARKGNSTIRVKIGSKTAIVNDKEVMMQLAAFLFEGRTMVPARLFEEGLNAQVEWNPQTGRLVVAMAG